MCFRDLQRALSVEDVGRPSAVRSVGHVAQAFPDGTILLELSRPPNGPFGFLISRGKGRPDSGERPPSDVHMIRFHSRKLKWLLIGLPGWCILKHIYNNTFGVLKQLL